MPQTECEHSRTVVEVDVFQGQTTVIRWCASCMVVLAVRKGEKK